MIGNMTQYFSITRLAALVLLAICLVQVNVRAQEPRPEPTMVQATPTSAAQSSNSGHKEHIEIISYSFGVGRRQIVRYTWANLNNPDPQQREFEPWRIEVKLLAADGSVIAETSAPAVEAGQFQSFDFNRDQINLPGEAGTGRLQVRLEVTVMGKYYDITLKRGVLETFDDAAEIIDTLTGRTTVLSKPKEIVVVGSKIREN